MCVNQVGSYEGFLAVWESILRVQPDAVPPRTCKPIESLRSLVDEFPRTQEAAAAMDFLELMEKIRAKYRQICSGLPGDTPKVSSSRAHLSRRLSLITPALTQLAPLSGGGPEGLSF